MVWVIPFCSAVAELNRWLGTKKIGVDRSAQARQVHIKSLRIHLPTPPNPTYSRWYDHEWLKADYKPDSPTHPWALKLCLLLCSQPFHITVATYLLTTMYRFSNVNDACLYMQRVNILEAVGPVIHSLSCLYQGKLYCYYFWVTVMPFNDVFYWHVLLRKDKIISFFYMNVKIINISARAFDPCNDV